MEIKKLQKLDSSLKLFKVLNAVSIPLFIFLFLGGIAGAVFFSEKDFRKAGICVVIALASIAIYPIISSIHTRKIIKLNRAMEDYALNALDLDEWKYIDNSDITVSLKSSQAVNNYDEIKFFKENPEKLPDAYNLLRYKKKYAVSLLSFLKKNDLKEISLYSTLEEKIEHIIYNCGYFFIVPYYISPAGRSQNERRLAISEDRLKELMDDKSILMTKGEYSRYLKEQSKELLGQKQHEFYEKVNDIIDRANDAKDRLVIDSDEDKLDDLVASLFDRTVNSIKKVKTVDSEEWDFIGRFISGISEDLNNIIERNDRILEYYDSAEFAKIKTTCDSLMNTQREFNEYIDEKVRSISELFGTNVLRNETSFEDEYNYIHPYKKSITPFVAEVSAAVFASAENSPLDYVVKHFYPDKNRYPEQIQKLHLLIEELETLKEAKQIIDNYKKDIQQYLTEVPSFVMDNDEDGFYSRLGFATINENSLVIEYKFSYTSGGGKAQRSFTIPMTEDTIVELIKKLESKLTMTAFSKEQRSLMTSRLRQHIKERDDFTCKFCGNSTYKEPNLLLEIDHIIPVAKGGCTEENNLQTLCWKCNRQKSSKIV